MNKNKPLIISIISVIVIAIVVIVVLTIKKTTTDTSKNIIGTNLEEKLQVTPNIEKNNKNEVIIYEGNEIFHFDYRDNELVYENIINKEDNSVDYKIVENEEQFYILNKKTNKKSESFSDYIEIKKNNKVIYLIIKTNEEFSIYNVSNDKYVKLSREIIDFFDIYDPYNNLKSDKYIIAINENGKFGVIDYEGKVIIDFKYDNINLIGENFLARKEGKAGVLDKNQKTIIDFKYSMLFEYGKNYLSILNGKYGVIDSNGKELLEHKYDFGLVENGHIALSIDGKVTFFTDKIIMEPTLTLDDPVKLSSYNFSNEIILLVNNKTYIFDRNGKTKKTLDDKLFAVMYEDKLNVYSNKYLYSRSIENNSIKFKVYGKDYNEHYSFDIKFDTDISKYGLNTAVYEISDNRYEIDITLVEKDTNNVYKEITYAYDFDNKKEITSDNMEKSELENGLKYTIDAKNVLKIYKEDKVIGEYENILYFIDNYYFISSEGIVYKLEFKYE